MVQLKTAIKCLIASVLLIATATSAGPSAQQEHELLLLDALSRKQISNIKNSNNINSISTNNNNYESNAIMDMLGRSMLIALFVFVWKRIRTFAFSRSVA